ncbi:Inositol-1-monophosphatase [hydrothermal vent metagenome]|uniref:inositol-phosphate phosphatase n=1 Tax=hydrothermal vent metagenome TaxID=652676 RepID=A0A3B1C790_9ZZZZ
MNKKSAFADILLYGAQLAKVGGGAIMEYIDKDFNVERKGEIDLVTEADIASEKAILKSLRDNYPDHQVITEERDIIKGNPEKVWIIDPLDGTTNFAHRFPMFCVSIAFMQKGVVQTAAIYDPLRKELFTAGKGMGTAHNSVEPTVSKTDKIIDSLLATGFSYNIKTIGRNNIREFGNFALKAQGMRRSGSAALDLAYVACGRLDGFWEFDLNPWDMAAGALIVEEAGGSVTRADGSPFNLMKKEIVASNGVIHDEMLKILAIK